ncbi:MAG TPA: hypothetical protein VGK19_08460 [Capsulimonadaceae bacterium]
MLRAIDRREAPHARSARSVLITKGDSPYSPVLQCRVVDASFGGVAALLAMLNSCSGGVAVVNIDNGFGAGCYAHRINSVVV